MLLDEQRVRHVAFRLEVLAYLVVTTDSPDGEWFRNRLEVTVLCESEEPFAVLPTGKPLVRAACRLDNVCSHHERRELTEILSDQ